MRKNEPRPLFAVVSTDSELDVVDVGDGNDQHSVLSAVRIERVRIGHI